MKKLIPVMVIVTSLSCIVPVMARPYAGLSGLAASADDATTAGTNPAGIMRFDQPAQQLELMVFFTESSWEGQLGENGPEYKTDDSGEIVVPSGYMIRPINDRFSFSFTFLGVGFSDDLGDWPGRYFMESYDSINISAFPSLAYRVNDKLSIAGSLALTYAIFEQERAVANIFDPGFGDGSTSLETDGVDVGFGLSMLYEISDRTRWGLAYVSERDPTLEGDAKFKNLGPNTQQILDNAGLLGAEIEVKSRTPQSLLAGIYHEFHNQHAVTVDLAWSDFSEFKLSEFYFDGEALSENEADYKDIIALSASYSWPVNDRWMLSVAGMYVDDMIDDDKRTMTLRLDSMWSLGMAAEWQWTESRAVQFGINYMALGDAPVDSPEIPLIGSVSGEFSSNDVIFLRLGLTFGTL